MRARILPPEEWGRLGDADITALLPLLKPENVRLVVVESDEGEVIATWAAIRQVEFEGLWISPEHRNGGVVKALINETMEAARPWANAYGVTWSREDKVSRQIERMGGNEFQARTFFLPMQPIGRT